MEAGMPPGRTFTGSTWSSTAPRRDRTWCVRDRSPKLLAGSHGSSEHTRRGGRIMGVTHVDAFIRNPAARDNPAARELSWEGSFLVDAMKQRLKKPPEVRLEQGRYSGQARS